MYAPYGENEPLGMVPQRNESTLPSCRVYVNPHFNKKVFINPNFQFNREVLSPTPSSKSTKIYLNPNIFKSLNPKAESNCVPINPTVFSTRTKLIRSTTKIPTKPPLRRNSLISQYKIIKSSYLSRPSIPKSAFKIKLPDLHKPLQEGNKFKIDNRKPKAFLLAKNRRNKIIQHDYNKKSLCLVKIGETLYRKSRNTLQKTTHNKTVVARKLNRLVTPNTIRYKPKLVSLKARTPLRNVYKKRMIINARNIPQRKMKLSNIPCLYYRKLGKCSGLKSGKCFRKHDPDQIALCTKFLQGACVNEKCALSHNVSPEKMPTCKFYLEGSCSKDNCPYVHVKLSPKADICKDFLEGFCKNGANCDRRHQLLCPYYEKTGNCPKPRCPYPHGKMVRKYTVGDIYKLAKKQSKPLQKLMPKLLKPAIEELAVESTLKTTVKTRYYTELTISENAIDNDDPDYCNSIPVRSKLGQLPSFIALR